MQFAGIDNPRAEMARFKNIARQICDILATEGIRARPWQFEDLPHFSRFSPENRFTLLHFLEIYLLIISEISRDKGSLVNSCRRLTTRFLELAELTPAGDLVDSMKDGDFLAAYGSGQHMTFLSPNHLIYMSYTIEDLFCRPWMTIFRRSEEIEKILMGRAYDFLTGKRTTTCSNMDIPPHTLTESESEERRSITCQSKLYSPLFSEGMAAGFISINCPLFGVGRTKAR